jgi:hypothetical protein
VENFHWERERDRGFYSTTKLYNTGYCSSIIIILHRRKERGGGEEERERERGGGGKMKQ